MFLSSKGQGGVESHLGTGFLEFPGTGKNKSSHNKCLGLGARLRQAALYEQLIQTNFGSGRQLVLRAGVYPTLSPSRLVEGVEQFALSKRGQRRRHNVCPLEARERILRLRAILVEEDIR